MEDNKERIYSRKVLVKGVFKQRSVKESEMNDKDLLHYYNTIREVYNAAPPIVKERFAMDAYERLMDFLVANGMAEKQEEVLLEEVKLKVVKKAPARKPAKKSSEIVN